MSKTSFFTFFFALFVFQLSAQKPDSIQVAGRDSLTGAPSVSTDRKKSKIGGDQTVADTSLVKEKKKGLAHRVFSKNYPNPRLAALFSFVLPGAGQAYNKKWWKIPIVWGALAGIGYFTFDTQKTYHELRDNYKILVDGDPTTNPTEAPYNTFDEARTKAYRDTFRGYTEKWYLALGVTYLLNVTDAFVDAHLSRFDVSENLGLRLKPSLETGPGLPAFGIGIALDLHKPKAKSFGSIPTHP